jgi:hypothetical protein
VILCPIRKTITAEGIATLFFYKVYKHFGLYDKIISDWGPQFASSFTRELGKVLRYNLSLSTAYHPQTDGETERVNQEVDTYLQILCGDNPTTWFDLITQAEFAHNHRPHSVTGKSPFFLMMGFKPCPLPTVIAETNLPAIESWLKTLSAARDEALAAHKLAQQVMSARNGRGFVPFSKGDKVWLKAKNLKRDLTSRKFASKWERPFTIIQVLSPITYQLRLPKMWSIHNVFHASLLSPYCKNPVHGPNFPAPPPDLIEGEKEFEILRILRHKGPLNNHLYLIQWKGYTAEKDTWIPERELKYAKTTLLAYKKAHPIAFPKTNPSS